MPALETHPLDLARSASAVTLAIVGVAAVVIVWRNRVAMVVVVGAIATGITTTILDIQRPSALNVYLFRGSSVAVLGTLIWIIGNAVFGGGHITFHRIQGAIAIYLMIGLTFMHVYALISLLCPNAFVDSSELSTLNQLQRGRFLYFSFTTLTSTGYGDIVPLHPVARSVAILEALIGQLFPTTMVARLVTLQIDDRRSRS
jgi:voltage-gated potassium channel Kch